MEQIAARSTRCVPVARCSLRAPSRNVTRQAQRHRGARAACAASPRAARRASLKKPSRFRALNNNSAWRTSSKYPGSAYWNGRHRWRHRGDGRWHRGSTRTLALAASRHQQRPGARHHKNMVATIAAGGSINKTMWRV